MRHLWLLVALAGCNQIIGIDDLTRVDASGTEVDSPAGQLCAMFLPSKPCFPLPTGTINLGNTNTDTDQNCATGMPFCALAADTITISSSGAIITGSKPLVLVATTAIQINGPLDASSTSYDEARGRAGAGSSPVSLACPQPPGAGGDDGGGGGAGGSFGSKGGDGGNGAGGNGGDGTGADDAETVIVFRAGCRGTTGGNSGGGAGGYGGGALYLLAGMAIVIESRVDANGAGGSGGSAGKAAGGGGGSGGMIVLDAPSITLNGSSAKVTANGGGGGEGAGIGISQEGDESSDWNQPALGGKDVSPAGGDGGIGAIGVVTGGVGSVGTRVNNIDGGGGGGGGGVGVIWTRGATPSGPLPLKISPPPR